MQIISRKVPLISQWLLISLLLALLHIAFDHNDTDAHDRSSTCDVCRLVQIDAASTSQVSISLDKYTRTDFTPIIQYSPSIHHDNFFARGPPT